MHLLRRLTKQRLAISEWQGELGPRVAKILENNKKDANQMTTDWTGKGNFQVKDGTSNLFRVESRVVMQLVPYGMCMKIPWMT